MKTPNILRSRAIVAVAMSAGLLTAFFATKCAADCAPPPAGLVSWWRGEGNALDQVGPNNGSLAGNTTYGTGRVGQSFVLDGNGDAVTVGNPASLRLQDFTIEAWIRRGSTTRASLNSGGGLVFGYGEGGYAIGLLDNGTPFLTRVGIDQANPNTTITDTNLHHFAVTKAGSTVVFYIDGVAFSVPAYVTTYTFGSAAAIGARGDNLANSFLGRIDEASIYNRALSVGEILSVYNAGSSGKCVGQIAPVFLSQPADKSLTVGSSATFSVTVAGTSPFGFQWRLNGTNIAGATRDSLTIENIQFTNAGQYSIAVSNVAGTTNSSSATLTVNPTPPCVQPPAGLVSWWRGEGNALDQIAGNNGLLLGNTTFGSGRVGQGFALDGSGDAVLVGNATNLQLQNFTIEAWIKRGSTTRASQEVGGGSIFAFGSGGYGVGILDNGTPYLTRIGIDNVAPNVAITDTAQHHFAVTKAGTTVVFYVDGVAYPVPAYSTTYTFGSSAGIGARGDNLGNSFLGTIDEVTIYNRALSAADVQAIYDADGAGKCHAPDCSEQLAATQAQLAAANATNALLQTQLAAASATNSVLQGQLATAQATNTALTAQLVAANATIAALQAQLAAASNVNASLQAQLTVCNAALLAANQNIRSLENEIAALVLPMQLLTEDFRTLFHDPQFEIRGDTSVEQMQNLMAEIFDLPRGQKLAIYLDLGGHHRNADLPGNGKQLDSQ